MNNDACMKRKEKAKSKRAREQKRRGKRS